MDEQNAGVEPEIRHKARRGREEATPPVEQVEHTEAGPRSPFDQVIHEFVAAFDSAGCEIRLINELAAVGITDLDDLESHNLGTVRQALQALFRADAHVLLGLAYVKRQEVTHG